MTGKKMFVAHWCQHSFALHLHHCCLHCHHRGVDLALASSVRRSGSLRQGEGGGRESRRCCEDARALTVRVNRRGGQNFRVPHSCLSEVKGPEGDLSRGAWLSASAYDSLTVWTCPARRRQGCSRAFVEKRRVRTLRPREVWLPSSQAQARMQGPPGTYGKFSSGPRRRDI